MKIRVQTVELADVPAIRQFGRGFGPTDPNYSRAGLFQQILEFIEENFPNLATESFEDQPYTLYIWSETGNEELMRLLREHLYLAYPAAQIDYVNQDPPMTVKIDSAFRSEVELAPRLMFSAADVLEVDDGFLLNLPGLEDLYLFTDYRNPDPNVSSALVYVLEFASVTLMREAALELEAQYAHLPLLAQLENEE